MRRNVQTSQNRILNQLSFFVLYIGNIIVEHFSQPTNVTYVLLKFVPDDNQSISPNRASNSSSLYCCIYCVFNLLHLKYQSFIRFTSDIVPNRLIYFTIVLDYCDELVNLDNSEYSELLQVKGP